MSVSRATANIISKTTYERLEPRPQLKQKATKIFPYRSKVPLPVVGAFEGQVTKGNKQSQSMFYAACQQLPRAVRGNWQAEGLSGKVPH